MLGSLELVYWPIRGRGYPVVLLLKAARVPFTYIELAFDKDEHHGAKQRGELGLDDFPFGALPVLKIKSEEGEAVIAETSAILRYLETVVGRELVVDPSKELSPLDEARIDMVHSAALFNSTVLFNAASSPTWLEGGDPFEPRRLSNGGVLFSAAACAIAYTLSMVCDVFPFSLARPLAASDPRQHGTLEARFPACAAVQRAVEGSTGVVEWVASGERKERWSNWASFAPDKVRAAAERFDREVVDPEGREALS